MQRSLRPQFADLATVPMDLSPSPQKNKRRSSATTLRGQRLRESSWETSWGVRGLANLVPGEPPQGVRFLCLARRFEGSPRGPTHVGACARTCGRPTHPVTQGRASALARDRPQTFFRRQQSLRRMAQSDDAIRRRLLHHLSRTRGYRVPSPARVLRSRRPCIPHVSSSHRSSPHCAR